MVFVILVFAVSALAWVANRRLNRSGEFSLPQLGLIAVLMYQIFCSFCFYREAFESK